MSPRITKVSGKEWLGIVLAVIGISGAMIGVVRHIDGLELRIHTLEIQQEYLHGDIVVPLTGR